MYQNDQLYQLFWQFLLPCFSSINNQGDRIPFTVFPQNNQEQKFLEIVTSNPQIVQQGNQLFFSFPMGEGTVIIKLSQAFCKKIFGSPFTRYINYGGDVPSLFRELSFIPSIKKVIPNKELVYDTWLSQKYFKAHLPKEFGAALRKLIYAFFDSDEWIALYEKFIFEYTSDFIVEHHKKLFHWFTIWALENYPAIAKYAIFKNITQYFEPLSDYPFEQVIRFSPPFILWNIKDRLSSKKERGWTMHLIKGNNIRTAENLPISISKKMRHPFESAPLAFNYEEAFNYAKVVSLGGDEQLSIMANRYLKKWSVHEKFWSEVLRIMIQRNTPVDWHDNEEAIRLLGYLRHLKDENLPIILKGRTYHSLCGEAEDWHQKRLFLEQLNENDISWPKTSIPEFYSNDKKGNEYRIIELNSWHQLIHEGRYMKHCVADYQSDCFSGVISIWSLRKYTNQKIFRLATIEVNLGCSTVEQVKGKYNSEPTFEAMEQIETWAEENGLELIENDSEEF